MRVLDYPAPADGTTKLGFVREYLYSVLMAGLLTGWRDPGYQLKPLYDLVRSRVTPMGRLPIFHYAVAIDRIVPPRTTMPVSAVTGCLLPVALLTTGVASTNFWPRPGPNTGFARDVFL